MYREGWSRSLGFLENPRGVEDEDGSAKKNRKKESDVGQFQWQNKQTITSTAPPASSGMSDEHPDHCPDLRNVAA